MIYLDSNATSQVHPEVVEAMLGPTPPPAAPCVACDATESAGAAGEEGGEHE